MTVCRPLAGSLIGLFFTVYYIRHMFQDVAEVFSKYARHKMVDTFMYGSPVDSCRMKCLSLTKFTEALYILSLFYSCMLFITENERNMLKLNF